MCLIQYACGSKNRLRIGSEGVFVIQATESQLCSLFPRSTNNHQYPSKEPSSSLPINVFVPREHGSDTGVQLFQTTLSCASFLFLNFSYPRRRIRPTFFNLYLSVSAIVDKTRITSIIINNFCFAIVDKTKITGIIINQNQEHYSHNLESN